MNEHASLTAVQIDNITDENDRAVNIAVEYVKRALRCTLRSAPTMNVDHVLARARNAMAADLRDAAPRSVTARATVWTAAVEGAS